MTAQEAADWQQRHPQPSLWKGWQVQAAVGCVVVVLAGLGWLVQLWSGAVVLSCAYGVLAVLVPSALAVAGVWRSQCWAGGGAGAGFAAVLLWEGVKVVLVIVGLVLAPIVLGQWMHWLGLIAGFVVVVKAYMLGLITGR